MSEQNREKPSQDWQLQLRGMAIFETYSIPQIVKDDIESFIEKLLEEEREETIKIIKSFARVNLQTGEKEINWFFPETVKPYDIISLLTKTN